MFKFGHIIIRAVEEHDLSILWEMRQDEVILNNLFQTFPISFSTQKKWLESMLQNQKDKVFMVDLIDDEEAKPITIGCVRLNDIDFLNRKIEIGADIKAEYRGKKHGFGLYKAIINYCFNYLNMNKIYLYVFKENQIAIKLYNKVGFQIEGNFKNHIFKHGKYQDVLMMSLFSENEQ